MIDVVSAFGRVTLVGVVGVFAVKLKESTPLFTAALQDAALPLEPALTEPPLIPVATVTALPTFAPARAVAEVALDAVTEPDTPV